MLFARGKDEDTPREAGAASNRPAKRLRFCKARATSLLRDGFPLKGAELLSSNALAGVGAVVPSSSFR